MRVILLASAALILETSPAGAADWINAGIGDWFDPANWSTGAVPGPADPAVIANGGTVQVLNGDDAASAFGVIGPSSDTGTVEVTGAGSTWTTSDSLFVGDYGEGTLNISDGGAVITGYYGYVGANGGSAGVVNVTGAGSSWKVSNELRVGYAGNGTLEIHDGATVRSSGSYFGYYTGTTGSGVVDGAGSSLSTQYVYVGHDGNATLHVTGGGEVSSAGSSYIGAYGDSTSSVTVDGAGSSWSSGGYFVVGMYGDGTLDITAGAKVSSLYGYIGFFDTSTSAVTVDGPGSSWSSTDDLYVGTYGDATLTIANGAVVDVGGPVMIAVLAGSQGTLNIGAAADEAAVAAGTLNADTILFGDGTAELVFNHTDADYVFGADISGAGTIYHKGPGTTTLTGDSSGLYGYFQLSNGELFVDGKLGGSLIASGSGTRLGGEGAVGGASVINGAVIAPGHDGIGTLAVADNLYMAGGSTYEVEITSGSSDLIQVTGMAYIEGADIAIKRGVGPLALGAGYIILSADEGVYDGFGDITSDYTFVTPSLVYIPDFYGSDLVTVEFARNGVAFADVATTANQASVAAAADALGANNSVYSTILSLNAEEAQAAFDALSGEGHATIKGVLVENSAQVRDALLGRMRTAFAAPDTSGAASGYAPDALLSGPGAKTGGLWGQLYGGLGSRAADGNAAAADSAGGGLVIGTDAEIGDWRLGFAANAGITGVSIPDRATSGDSTDLGVVVYGGTEWGDTDFAFGASFTQHAISTTRDAGFDTLAADYGAMTGQLFAELDHEFDLGEFSLTPFGQVAYVSHATDAFTEQGGAAALSSAASTIDSTFATLGLRTGYQFVVGEDGLMTLGGGLGWRHAYADMPSADNAFAGGSAFTVSGTPIAGDAVLIEGGLDLNLANGIDLSLSYAGQVAMTAQSHVLQAGIGGQF